MTPFFLSADEPGLDDWGTPEDIGATTLDGSVRVSGRFDLGRLKAWFSAGSMLRHAPNTARSMVSMSTPLSSLARSS